MPASDTKSRRGFLQATAASALAAPWFIPRHVLGGPGRTAANERIQIGVIGCGVRGKYLIGNLPQSARVISLCDCATRRIDDTLHPKGAFSGVLQTFAETDASACSLYQDYRRMIAEETSLDAVMIATPDHHHALATILACQTGLDVYVEKPLSVTIGEGKAMVAAAERYGRVVQVGSQQRTMEVNRIGSEFVRSGGLGHVSRVEVRNFPGPMTVPDLVAQPIPDDVDWDLFCGPTRLRSYHRDLWIKDGYKVGYLTWRGWDLWRDYSGHLVTNWGAHSLDMVQWALGADETGPVEIRLERDLLEEWDREIDDRWHEKTPPLGAMEEEIRDRLRFCPVTMVYADGTTVCLDPSVSRNIYHGTQGQLEMSRNDYQASPEGLLPPPDNSLQAQWRGEGHVARPHVQNWLDCIRSRGTPNAPVEVGHRSATLCHLANLARELGRDLRWDPQREVFVGDPAADRHLDRPRRSGFELPEVG